MVRVKSKMEKEDGRITCFKETGEKNENRNSISCSEKTMYGKRKRKDRYPNGDGCLSFLFFSLLKFLK